jgi:hypothetical protein
MEVSQRTIERLIGRLLTDEELRLKFIDLGLWSQVAAGIDPRLQWCSLKTEHDETSR